MLVLDLAQLGSRIRVLQLSHTLLETVDLSILLHHGRLLPLHVYLQVPDLCDL